jgi:hypothetical protein
LAGTVASSTTRVAGSATVPTVNMSKGSWLWALRLEQIYPASAPFLLDAGLPIWYFAFYNFIFHNILIF